MGAPPRRNRDLRAPGRCPGLDFEWQMSPKPTAGQVLTEEIVQYLVWMSRAEEKYVRSHNSPSVTG